MLCGILFGGLWVLTNCMLFDHQQAPRHNQKSALSPNQQPSRKKPQLAHHPNTFPSSSLFFHRDLIPLVLQSRFGHRLTQNLSGLSPKQDCSLKRVKTRRTFFTPNDLLDNPWSQVSFPILPPRFTRLHFYRACDLFWGSHIILIVYIQSFPLL